MSRSTLGPVLSLLLCLSLAACSGDDPDDPADPSPPPGSSTEPSAGPSTGPTAEVTEAAPDGTFSCDQVTDEALSEATGADQRVLSPVLDGPLPSCRTAFDDRGMTIQWDFNDDSSSFAEVGEESELPGLEREEIEIGAERAWLLQGQVVGTDTARVVLLVDRVKLTVDANTAGDDAAAVTADELRTAAEAVASVYVG